MSTPLISYLALAQIPVRLRNTHPGLSYRRWLRSAFFFRQFGP